MAGVLLATYFAYLGYTVIQGQYRPVHRPEGQATMSSRLRTLKLTRSGGSVQDREHVRNDGGSRVSQRRRRTATNPRAGASGALSSSSPPRRPRRCGQRVAGRDRGCGVATVRHQRILRWRHCRPDCRECRRALFGGPDGVARPTRRDAGHRYRLERARSPCSSARHSFSPAPCSDTP